MLMMPQTGAMVAITTASTTVSVTEVVVVVVVVADTHKTIGRRLCKCAHTHSTFNDMSLLHYKSVCCYSRTCVCIYMFISQYVYQK